MYRISRRGFFKTGVVAGVLAATGMPTHAGQRGGTLRLALGGARETDTWDARLQAGQFMPVVTQGAVFDCLTELSATGELIGELAESWDSSADARVWTFTLRRGVTFHDGSPFGAKDVIASINLHRDPARASAAGPLVSDIVEMRTITPHQVQIVLSAGNVDFPLLMSDGHLVIYPADRIDDAMALGIGTGLYRVEAFEPGRRALLARVEGHYKDGRSGWFDSVEALAIGDAQDRLGALLAGRVDAAGDLPFDWQPDRRTAALAKPLETMGNRHFAFPMVAGLSPMDNLDLRRALKHAVDREALLASVFLGRGVLGNDHPVGPANPYLDTSLPQTSYDPDLARHLLGKSGLDGLSLSLMLPDSGSFGGAESALAYQLSARAARIEIRLSAGSGAAHWQAAHWTGRMTEDWMFSTGYQTGAAWNDSGWHDDRFQGLLRAARSEFDSGRRQALYSEMQEICRRDGATVIPVFVPFRDGHSPGLARPERIGSVAGLDSNRLIERWWFA